MDLPDAWAMPAAKAKERRAAAIPADVPPLELPTSKVIARLRYQPADRSLVVEFRNGSVYRYHGVSAEDYDALAKARSPGARFNTHIAPHHEAERID